jgi:ketosteroid isomerase-like protein
MSRENVDLARQVMDAISRRNVPLLAELAASEVEWYSFFAIGQEGGVYRGHEGTRRYMSDLTEAMEGVVAEVDDAIGVGDVAVLVGHIHSRGRGSGAVTTTPAGWMLKFRDGRLVCFRAFREPAAALEAVGLSE